jgi:hypothetical protein
VLFCIGAYIMSNRKNMIRTAIVMLILAAPVMYANKIFPMIRGRMWSKGMSISTLTSDVQMAQKQQGKVGLGPDQFLVQAFEAGNLNCFKFVIQNYPDTYPFLLGQTYFLKSKRCGLTSPMGLRACWQCKSLATQFSP